MLAPLRHEHSGVELTLKRFREGDISQIGSIKLEPVPIVASDRVNRQTKIQRDRFFLAIEECTRDLQWGCEKALNALTEVRNEVRSRVTDFEAKYGKLTFTARPLTVRANPMGLELARKYPRDAAQLRRFLSDRIAASPSVVAALSFCLGGLSSWGVCWIIAAVPYRPAPDC